jgi:beta-lactamase regulating signal transducer with metallopeptidase domain
VETLLTIVAIKACGAAALAAVAVLAGRRIGRPAAVHALWILVLLELLVPPVFEVGILPRAPAQPVTAGGALAAAQAVMPSGTVAAAPAPARDEPVRLPAAIATLWLAGGLGVLLLGCARTRRLGRSLAGARPAPPGLLDSADRLAGMLGLARSPRVRLVPAAVSPMLRCRLGAPEILFPARLLDRLSHAERDALLLHELAHVRRRDHWVRWLELCAAVLFWWHPAVWLARPRLRRAEELCCDAAVLRALPGRARAYARGLLKTVEFLAASRAPLPPLASGVGSGRDLEERLTMILKKRVPPGPTRLHKLVLALAAPALLLVLPTWADRENPAPAGRADSEREYTETDARAREDLLDMEQEALELEQRLRQVHVRRMELERALARERHEGEVSRLREEAAGLEAAGRTAEAEVLRSEERALLRELELEGRREDLERETMRRQLELEVPLRRTMLELERLEAGGSGDVRRAELEARARELQLELETQARMGGAQQQALELETVRAALERAHSELARREADGDERGVLEAEREMAELQEQMALRELELARESGAQRELRAEVEALRQRQSTLDERRRAAQADELRREIERLRLQLEELESTR